jgi:PAS domain S-box-containing protein
MSTEMSSTFEFHKLNPISLFEAIPGNHLLVQNDFPNLQIIAATPGYLEATGLTKEVLIGKRLFEAFPTNEHPESTQGNDLRSSFLHASTSKEPHFLPKYRYDVKNELGIVTEKHWKISNKPVLGSGNDVTHIVQTWEDITAKVQSERLRRDQNGMKHAYHLLMQAPIAIQIFSGADLMIELAHPPTLELWSRDGEVIGRPFLDVLPELRGEGYDVIMKQVMQDGTPRYFYEVPLALNRKGKTTPGYFNFIYQPYYEEDLKKASGLLVFATEVTEQVRDRKALEQSQRNLRNMILQAPVAMCILKKPDYTVDIANERMFELWGKQAAEVLHRPIFDGLPEAKDQGLEALLEQVSTSGQSYTATEMPVILPRQGKTETTYLNFVYEPIYDINGVFSEIMVVAIEVTEQVITRQTIERSEARFRSLIEEAPVATCLFVGRELKIEVANQMMIDVWGKGPGVMGLPLADALPELKGQVFLPLLAELFDTGKTYEAKGGRADLTVNGILTTFYFDYTFKPLKDKNGKVYAIMEIAIDVTEQVLSRQMVEEAQEALRGAVEIAQLGTWSIDVATGGLNYSDRLIEWFGYDPSSQDYNEVIPILSEEDRERVAAAVASALAPGSIGKYDETYSVISPRTGQRRILRAQGKVVHDHRGNAVRMIGAAQDVTIQHELQLALENEVQERTEALAVAFKELQERNNELQEVNKALDHLNKELERSNDNLEEFAYGVSHDLKEPVRKIHMFTSQFEDLRSGQLNESEIMTFSRIKNATERMRSLIDDVLTFSQVSKQPLKMESVDLNDKLQQVIEDLELQILEKQAELSIGVLPVVDGFNRQLEQLFQNLIANALKYCKADIPPKIKIKASFKWIEGKQYHLIDVIDNGIGFDQQYAQKIFQIFARLHGKAEYSGTGVGLSIAKKVVENHKGFISARSVPGEGSIFSVFLPCVHDI